MQRFYLFKRGQVFYAQDRLTGKQESLRTKDKDEARRIFHAKNEAHVQPAIGRQIAKAWLAASDPAAAARTWDHVAEHVISTKRAETRDRWMRAWSDKALSCLRDKKLIETTAEDFFAALKEGTVSTNVYLRRLHNFALDMNWVLAPVIPKKQWPQVRFGQKRAITEEEHQRIIALEWLPERKAYYELCWHLGGSQSDIACLCGQDIDWEQSLIAYRRKKTQQISYIHFSDTIAAVLKGLPKTGPLFPRLAAMHEKHRAAEFKRRCKRLKIEGVSLHSYRYAWAERAKMAGMPERFAMQALGHNSKAVHRAYAKNAVLKIPALELWEKKIVALPPSFEPGGSEKSA